MKPTQKEIEQEADCLRLALRKLTAAIIKKKMDKELSVEIEAARRAMLPLIRKILPYPE